MTQGIRGWLSGSARVAGWLVVALLALAGCDSQDGAAEAYGVVHGEVLFDPAQAGQRVLPDWIITVGDTGSGNGGGNRYRVPGAELQFSRLDDGLRSAALADHRGLYTTALATGNWRARARYVADREYVGVAAFPLGTAGAQLDIELAASAMLYGRAVAADPISAPVKVEIEELGSYALSDTEGAWLFPALPPGTWTVHFRIDGYGETSTRVTLAPAEDRNLGLTVVAARPGTAGGVRAQYASLLIVASDEQGQPVPEALCSIEGLGVYALAGSDGVARLTAVSGRYTVVCQRDGHMPARHPGVRFPADGGIASLAVTLPRRQDWGSLIVDLIDMQGRPVASAGIDLWTYERHAGALYTDERGRVRFEATDCVGLQALHAGYDPTVPFQACPNLLEGKDNYYVVTMCSGEECPPVWACLNGTRDCVPPETVITDAPPSAVTDYGNATDGIFVLAFAADEESTFMCRLNEGDWEPCTSPYVVDDLDYGLHTFRVFATDLEGNADRTPATVSWAWQVPAELWLFVDNCFPSSCGVHDVLNRTGWSPGTQWLHIETTPDLAYADGTTGAFLIRTDWLPPGRHEVAFNAGNLPNFGETMNNTRWLFGFDYVEGPGVDGGGYPFHSQRSWFEVHYGDGEVVTVPQDCSYTSLVLIDTSRPWAWDAYVGRGRAWVNKGYDGRLTIEPNGNPELYTWYFENYMPWYNHECLEYDRLSATPATESTD